MQQIAHDLEQKERTNDVLLQENVSFTSLLLSSDIKRGLAESGYKKPSPIQFKAIPLGRCGFDLIVKSKSGTGKTLVFSTIALETVNVTKDHLQVLILVPTREIAVQIQDVLRSIGRFVDGLCIESFIGGMPLEDDLKKVKRCHIAVGAPGRVKHLISLGALTTKSVRLFVLDEADKLMETAFQNDINEIYDVLPQRKQLIAASATYPKELDTFLANYMLSPTHVTSENETPLLLGLRQFVRVLQANAVNAVQQMKAKNEFLLDIFSKVSFTQCLVFTNYQSRTESVCNFLNQKGWNSSFISAAVEQSERLEAINNLKNFKNRILLSTDLTSRGIDAPNVDLVVNYDLPHDAVTYLHRMGRAGRYGSPGICVNLAMEGAEVRKLQQILGTIGATNLSISKLPTLNGVDLWRVDLGDLEQVWGVVGDEVDETREEIKKEVLTMKQRNKKDGEKVKKKSKKKVKEEREDAEDLLSSLLTNDSYEDDCKKRKRAIKIEDLCNTNNVLNVLKEKKEVETVADEADTVLSSLIQATAVTDDDTKKRKLNTPEFQRGQPKNTIFCKNRALLSITRLLCDSKVQTDPDLIESIDCYLNVLKSDGFKVDKTVEEILRDSTNSVIAKSEVSREASEEDIAKTEDGTNQNVPKTETEEDNLGDIFKKGYQSALKNENWVYELPPEELQGFQEFCRQEIISSESGDEEDCQMEEYQEEEVEEEEEISNDTNNALQWIPVEPESSDTHFTQCYDDCSNTLWQTGLTFPTVEDFDTWFFQWQEQLRSVRNYVQQNIYVEEMSKYQRRLTNK